MFAIESLGFYAKIKDSADTVLQKVYLQLSDILSNNCINYLQKAQEINNKLTWTIHDNSPNFVDYFVNYQVHVQKAKLFESQETYLVGDMNALVLFIQSLRLKVPEVHRQKVLDANYITTNIRQKIDDAESEYDSKYSNAMKKLFLQIPDIQSQIQNISYALEENIFLYDSKAFDAVLTKLVAIKEKIDAA